MRHRLPHQSHQLTRHVFPDKRLTRVKRLASPPLVFLTTPAPQPLTLALFVISSPRICYRLAGNRLQEHQDRGSGGSLPLLSSADQGAPLSSHTRTYTDKFQGERECVRVIFSRSDIRLFLLSTCDLIAGASRVAPLMKAQSLSRRGWLAKKVTNVMEQRDFEQELLLAKKTNCASGNSSPSQEIERHFCCRESLRIPD